MQSQSRDRQKRPCKIPHYVAPLSDIHTCIFSNILRGHRRNQFYRWMTLSFTCLSLQYRGPMTCINLEELKERQRKAHWTAAFLSSCQALRKPKGWKLGFFLYTHTNQPVVFLQPVSSLAPTCALSLALQCSSLRT